MATAYDTWKTAAPEPYDLDDAAYEALRAHPAMLEEAMSNMDSVFWAKAARMLDSEDYALYGVTVADARDAYVKEKVEDYASDEEISINEAINRMLKECFK